VEEWRQRKTVLLVGKSGLAILPHDATYNVKKTTLPHSLTPSLTHSLTLAVASLYIDCSLDRGE
jgi:hypothetical protein